jgi:uncharacterized protein YjiS (DUF1127 family)
MLITTTPVIRPAQRAPRPLFVRIRDAILAADARHRDQCRLMELTDVQLDDIGLTRDDLRRGIEDGTI